MNDISPPRCGPGRMLPLLLTLIVATLSGCSDAEPNAASSEAPSAPLPDAGPIFASEEVASVPSPADATTPSLPDTPASAAEIEASVDTTTIPEAGPSADVPERAPSPKGAPVIATIPESHSFSYISPLASPMLKQVTIHNLGADPLIITSIGFVAGSSPDFDIVLIPPMPKTIGPNQSTLLNVRFSELQGGEGTLRIESNDPENPSQDIVFDSYIKASVDVPEPCVALSPSQLNFGTVVRGQQSTLSATLSNCATDQSLTLKKIDESGSFFFPLSDEFQLDPEPQTPQALAPGQQLTVNVTYSPKLAGADSGTYEFHTDDPGQPVAHLDVSGLGVEPPPEEIGLTIKISWDADQCDVDSHLLMPGGAFFDCDSDCHYGNPSPDWGVQGDWSDDPFLDVDDVDGYGPEHINISDPIPGDYRFIVHYYDDTHNGGSSTATDTTVQVLSYGQVVAEFGPITLDKTNRNWDVFDLTWVSSAVPPTITALGNTYMVPASAVQACWPSWP